MNSEDFLGEAWAEMCPLNAVSSPLEPKLTYFRSPEDQVLLFQCGRGIPQT